MILPVFISLVAMMIGLWLVKILLRTQTPSFSHEEKIKNKIAEAQAKAQAIRQKAEIDSKHVQAEAKIQMTEYLEHMAQDLKEMQEQIKRREETLKNREENLNLVKQNQQEREKNLKERVSKIVPIPKMRQDFFHHLHIRLTERIGQSKEAVIQELVETKLQEVQLHAVKLKLTAEEIAKNNSEKQAKRIIRLANERFNMSHQPEKEHPGFRLYDPDIFEKVEKDISFRDAFMAATESEIFSISDNSCVEVKSVDPLKREIGRRTLVYMKAQGVIHANRIATVLQRVQKEVDKELEYASERATRLLQIAPLTGEVKRLFSRLLYRASYSQNQWHHAVEVAYVCGLMAAELGLDVKTARRAGLLHDIGKAMTHDHEGSHALLGADVARKQGESEEVANAIAAHHGEEPNISPYAEITAAGDAISGARPGARREIQEEFSSKVQDLEDIAYAVPGIERVQVMQGGREVRVFVGEKDVYIDNHTSYRFSPDEFDNDDDEFVQEQTHSQHHRTNKNAIKDEQMLPIARKIAENIEEQLTYPGQIRITVIREMRAVGIAK